MHKITYEVDDKQIKKPSYFWKDALKVLLVIIAVLYMQTLVNISINGFTFNSRFVYIVLSSIIIGGFIGGYATFFNGKGQTISKCIFIFILAFLCCLHIVYTDTFQTLFSWSTIGIADELTDFYREALVAIGENWYWILLEFLPFILFIVFGKKLRTNKRNWLALAIIVLVLVLEIVLINNNKDDQKVLMDIRYDANETMKRYGVVVFTFEDVWQCFNPREEVINNPYLDGEDVKGLIDVHGTIDKVIPKNQLDIDFDKMIAAAPNNTIKDMHKYFSTVPASNINEYTGMFKDKNLIFLTLEGFSYKVISEKYTPTLYKMATQGFVFTNFYDSLWGGSTATGEYTNMTGNFYSTADCLSLSANTYTYSAMGNMFKRAGYATRAYHDHTYDYYSRNLSHPNFGYTYKGCGNGLIMDYHWPRSDYECAVATIDEYINSDVPFHTYYMTISAHTNYTWKGNHMASRHQKDVADYPSNNELLKGYIACNIEVENMLTYLVKRLDEAGKLEDTVFAMCCDHYPYGLKDDALSELYGLTGNIHANYELYHNQFILWSASMEEPIVIDKPCSSYDMVPTLANLFGLEYDSRFITGTDILSDNENIVIINTSTNAGGNWNWITEQGRYSTVSKQFTPSSSCTLTDDERDNYVANITNKVAAMRKYSLAILNNDYYSYVFNKDGTAKYPMTYDN